MSPTESYPRDLIGYGRQPPDPRWPGGARVAVQFVVNYEEGGESNILHGDAASEAFLSESLGAQPWPGQRHMNVESMYEYGSRAGFWRVWRLFTAAQVPVTVFGVATRWRATRCGRGDARSAVGDREPRLKWIDYRDVPEAEERADLAEAIRIHTEATGERPLGWYTGRSSVQHAQGGAGRRRLSLLVGLLRRRPALLGQRAEGPAPDHPLTLDANDMRFVNAAGLRQRRCSSSAISRTPSTCSTPRASARRR